MRVLHVVESFATGVLGIVEQLANGASRSGADIHIAFSRRLETPADFSDRFDSETNFHEIDLARGLNPKKDILGIVTIYKLIKRLKPDVVHLHSSKAGFLGRLAWRAAWLMGEESQLFYSPHGFSFLQQNLSKAKKFAYLSLERLAYFNGGVVVGCSSGESQIARDNLGNRRIATIENAVCENDLPPRKKQNCRAIRIVTAGRISYQKDPVLFAQLAAEFVREDIEFVWVGAAAQGQEGLASVLEDRIRVTGWLPRQSALEEIAASDIYLQTSRWEGMPVSVIEAMMMGLPAIVSNVVGNRDVVTHGSTGYVFARKPDAASCLRKLIFDTELRETMGRHAAAEARLRFSSRRFLSEWSNLYGLAREPEKLQKSSAPLIQ